MASDEPNSGQICVQSSAGSTFPQNGQLDWIAFIKGTAQATISILTRLSAFGVEPLTVLVAQNVFSTLCLSSEGQKNVIKALSSLRAFGSLGNVLWFGFGIQHLVRSLAQTREGLGCISLCGALADSHSAEISALVLSAFADLSQVPKEVSPSIAQWKQLVQACGGCLSMSGFNGVVREFTHLYGLTVIQKAYETSDPHDLAKALHALGKVSSGQLDSIVLSGGPECGWLGAVAQWLLGLSVVVQLEDESKPTFYGIYAKANESPRVRIVYECGNSRDAASLDIRKSYKLRTLSDIVRQQIPNISASLCVRVPWSIALSSTFGKQALEDLTITLATTFITALGSAACLTEHVVRASAGIKQEWLRNTTYYTDGTFGRGLLSMVSSCFPEISSDITLRGMSFLGQTFNEASMAYESAISKISVACGCGCEDKRPVLIQRKPTICLRGLFEAIILITRLKAGILVDRELLPSQNGLYNIYEHNTTWMSLSPTEKLLGLQPGTRIDKAAVLYGGCTAKSSTRAQRGAVSAITHRGLCFFLNSLSDISYDPEGLSQVHVVPGIIELDRRIYPEVRDTAFEGPKYQAKREQIVTTEPRENVHVPNDLTLEAVAMETETHVVFSYKVSSPLGTSYIPPATLSISAAQALGNVSCHSSSCSRLDDTPPIKVIEGEGKAEASNTSTRIHFVPRNGPAWCIALLSAFYEDGYSPVISLNGIPVQPDLGSNGSHVILRTSECISCCLRAAMKYDQSDIIYVV